MRSRNMSEIITEEATNASSVPSLSELRVISSGLPQSHSYHLTQVAPPDWFAADDAWGDLVQMYLRPTDDVYLAFQQLLPVLFFVDGEEFHSERGKRIVEHANRWLCYWFCKDHRYGRPENQLQPEMKLPRIAC